MSALKTVVQKYAIAEGFITSKIISPPNDTSYYYFCSTHAAEVKKRGFRALVTALTEVPYNWKIKEDFIKGPYGPTELFMFVLIIF